MYQYNFLTSPFESRGRHFLEGAEVKKGTELFWYETADGEHVPVEDPRFGGPDTKKVSGVVVRIDPGSPSEDVDSTNLAGWFPGPYVLIKFPGGTMEVNREWWDSIFIK